jgi:ubiquinone/menaquinone biosynthesis C-methylase UbiE
MKDIEKWLRKDGERFLKAIGIKKGFIIVDFGCGSGDYTLPAAKVVGKTGIVYAVDKNSQQLDHLMQVAPQGLPIIPLGISGEVRIEVADHSVDAVLLYDVLHYENTNNRKRLYNEVHRILKRDALLSVYPKHCKMDSPFGKLSDMALEDVIREIEDSHFHLERKDVTTLIHNHTYTTGCILIFRKR